MKELKATSVPLPTVNIDTDQIIPARFLKKTDKAGLGEGLFHNWRYDESGNTRPDFVLNHPERKGAAILVAGNNLAVVRVASMLHGPWLTTGSRP